jgi:hypothetical protein
VGGREWSCAHPSNKWLALTRTMTLTLTRAAGGGTQVRVGKLLASHGRNPGRMTGPCTLSADDRSSRAGGRLTLRISMFDSMLRLKCESPGTTASKKLRIVALGAGRQKMALE